MGSINKIPLGFLSMIQSQTGGKNPSQSADFVSPVIDMSEFYHAQNLSNEWVQLVHVGVNVSSTIEVPSDEAWFLWAIGVVQPHQTSAVDFVWGSVGLNRLPKSGLIQPVELFTFKIGPTSGAANGRMEQGVTFGQRIPLVSGTQIQTSITDRAAVGARTLTTNLLVSKFKQ